MNQQNNNPLISLLHLTSEELEGDLTSKGHKNTQRNEKPENDQRLSKPFRNYSIAAESSCPNKKKNARTP